MTTATQAHSAHDPTSPDRRHEIGSVPTERLEAEICELAAHIAAGEARWLDLIAEFDRREGWALWGIASCAHWLSWKCALTSNAARERVRVAHAVQELPHIHRAFQHGELSYSKVRALTRVATEVDEADLLELARHATANQLEILLRAWRRCLDTDLLDKADRQRQNRLLTWRYDDDGCLRGRFCLPPEDDTVFIKGIESRTAPPTKSGDDVSAETPTLEQRRADALIELIDAALGARTRSGDERVMTIIEVDSAAMAQSTPGKCRLQNGPAIASETARRLHCDSTEMFVSADNPTQITPTTKTIPRQVRRALRLRDKEGCRFPACGRTAWVEAHHIVHRADGGSHDLENLATLCKHHHHLVHEGGFSVEAVDGGSSFRFFRPDGTPVPTSVTAVTGSQTGLHRHSKRAGLKPTPTTLDGGSGERLDLDFTIWALHSHHRERSQPFA